MNDNEDTGKQLAIARLAAAIAEYAQSVKGAQSPPVTPPPALRIWPAHPGAVLYRGKMITLTAALWRVLFILAQTPRKVVTYGDLGRQIWQGRGRVSRKQILAHRAALERKLGAGVVTIARGNGLMLDMSADKIKIETD